MYRPQDESSRGETHQSQWRGIGELSVKDWYKGFNRVSGRFVMDVCEEAYLGKLAGNCRWGFRQE